MNSRALLITVEQVRIARVKIYYLSVVNAPLPFSALHYLHTASCGQNWWLVRTTKLRSLAFFKKIVADDRKSVIKKPYKQLKMNSVSDTLKFSETNNLLSETDNFFTWRLSVEENYRFLRVKYLVFQHFFLFVFIFTDSEEYKSRKLHSVEKSRHRSYVNSSNQWLFGNL